MYFEFANKRLRLLYVTGRSQKGKLPDRLVRKFVMRINQIEAATSKNDLVKTKGLHFEKLGGYENRYLIRLDRKCRLEFKVDWENKEETRGLFRILKMSKHYGD